MTLIKYSLNQNQNQMPEETQQAEKVVTETGTTKFGLAQVNQPTPLWVKWIFRVEFVMNKAFGIWLASQATLTNDQLKNLVLWATITDFVIWGLGKFVGITKEQIDT